MKLRTIYICETCGKESENADEIKKCEANHLGLTMDEMLQYKGLKEIVRRRSCTVSVTNNEITRGMYDEAIDNVLVFEKEHGIKS